MAVLYTPKQIQAALITLRIKPLNGLVTTEEAAKILTWRAQEERGIHSDYTSSAVRRHVELGNLTVAHTSGRFNRYKVEDIFDLPIMPRKSPRKGEPNAA